MIAAFVILIGGASFLYNKLSPKVTSERLSTNMTPPADDSRKITLSETSTGDKDNSNEEENADSDISSEQRDSIDSGLSSEQAASTDTNDNSDTNDSSEIPAPDFTVYDIDGDAVSLSDFIGKPVIINFWASWCGPCKMEMPEFEEKFNELGGDIQFLMVNLTDGNRETRETAISYIEESGYTFPVYFDTDQDAAYTYGVYSIPSTYFIGADGSAVAMAQGSIDGSVLDQGISMIYSPDNL